MKDDYQSDRLPVKIDTTSNGEFVPSELPRTNQIGNRVALEMLETTRKSLRTTRRLFMRTTSAAAASLLAFNQVNAAAGRTGGYFHIPDDAAFDTGLAESLLNGNEFIFDVQGHYVVPPSLRRTLKPTCAEQSTVLNRDYMRCIGADDFIKDIFFDSDTDMMVLSFVPSYRDDEPLTAAEAAATRQIVDKLDGTNRLLIHGRCNPNQAGDLEGMDELAEKWDVSAWKCYTQWGPDGRGFFLTDEQFGIPFIEKARRLGIKTICIHKGIPFSQNSYEHSLCTDIGRAAAMFPDVNFLVYHSGYVPGETEGPYDKNRGAGIDELIASVERENLGYGSNVYAELGTTWRFLMRNPNEAAHVLGKLVKHLGEDNVLYGSDCVWYGSPQDQIQALRRFQISTEFQQRYAYPALSSEIKAKIFGLNAARVYGIDANEIRLRSKRDHVQAARENSRNDPRPHFDTWGPKNRREFFALRALRGNAP